MEAKLFQNVLGGLVQEDTPIRVVDIDPDGNPVSVAYDVKRLEIINGVAYLIMDLEKPHIVPLMDV